MPELPAPPPPAPPSAGRGRTVGVLGQILGRDEDDDDRPLPHFPPLPADPRWRIEHLPLLTAIGIALALCAGSVGFLLGGPVAGIGLAAGVALVVVGFTMTTLAISWADVVRPQLVLPVGLATYVIKYALILGVLLAAGSSGWRGTRPMAYGVAIGAVVMAAAMAWWMARRSRHLPVAD